MNSILRMLLSRRGSNIREKLLVVWVQVSLCLKQCAIANKELPSLFSTHLLSSNFPKFKAFITRHEVAWSTIFRRLAFPRPHCEDQIKSKFRFKNWPAKPPRFSEEEAQLIYIHMKKKMNSLWWRNWARITIIFDETCF